MSTLIKANETEAISKTNASKNLTDADKLSSQKREKTEDTVAINQDNEDEDGLDVARQLELAKSRLEDKQTTITRMQTELQSQFSQLNELKKLVEIKETALSEAQCKETQLNADIEMKRGELKALNERLGQLEGAVREMRERLDEKTTLELNLKTENERLEHKIG